MMARASLQRGPRVDNRESGEHQAQCEISRLGPPGVQVFFDIEDGLQSQPNPPEHGDIAAESTGQSAAACQLGGVANAERRKRDNRQHNITSVHPMHLPMQAPKAAQFVLPV
jgi:hypothetical protein